MKNIAILKLFCNAAKNIAIFKDCNVYRCKFATGIGLLLMILNFVQKTISIGLLTPQPPDSWQVGLHICRPRHPCPRPPRSRSPRPHPPRPRPSASFIYSIYSINSNLQIIALHQTSQQRVNPIKQQQQQTNSQDSFRIVCLRSKMVQLHYLYLYFNEKEEIKEQGHSVKDHDSYITRSKKDTLNDTIKAQFHDHIKDVIFIETDFLLFS